MRSHKPQADIMLFMILVRLNMGRTFHVMLHLELH